MEKIVALLSWFAGAAIGHYLFGLGAYEAFTVAGIGLIIWFLTEIVIHTTNSYQTLELNYESEQEEV